MALNVTHAVNQAAFENLFTQDPTDQPAYIASGVVNEYAFTVVRIVELEPGGSCCIFGSYIPDKTHPDVIVNAVVISSAGKEMIFKNSSAALNFVNKMNYGSEPDYPIEYVRCVVISAVGDPVATAKTQYTAQLKESALAADSVTSITQKLTGAASLGWNTMPANSPSYAAYARYAQAKTTLEAWKTATEQRTAKLRDVLVAAGVLPATPATPATP